jgi:AraC-like DNA-binding protein
MFTAAADVIELHIPPWPEFLTASYRSFKDDEKHVTRICKDFVLLFMLESSLFFVEDGRSVEVEAGSWYIQVPGLKQEGRKGSPAPKYFYIHFQAVGESCEVDEEGVIGGNLVSHGTPARFCIPVKGSFFQHHFKPLFNKLLMPLLQPADILKRQAVFLNMLNNLICLTDNEKLESKDLALQLMAYLADHYNTPAISQAMSDQFHFTADYLTRRMKRYSGITPYQYIQQIRIEKAKELLANTDYKLSFIAKEVGYHDLTVFYKAFRKTAGIAPGKWRLRNRRLHSE